MRSRCSRRSCTATRPARASMRAGSSCSGARSRCATKPPSASSSAGSRGNSNSRLATAPCSPQPTRFASASASNARTRTSAARRTASFSSRDSSSPNSRWLAKISVATALACASAAPRAAAKPAPSACSGPGAAANRWSPSAAAASRRCPRTGSRDSARWSAICSRRAATTARSRPARCPISRGSAIYWSSRARRRSSGSPRCSAISAACPRWRSPQNSRAGCALIRALACAGCTSPGARG